MMVVLGAAWVGMNVVCHCLEGEFFFFEMYLNTIHMARSQPKPARTDSGRSTPELAKRLSYVRYLNQLHDLCFQGQFELLLA